MVEFTQPDEQKKEDSQDLPPLVRSSSTARSSSARRHVLLQRIPTRKRTPPTLLCWDRSVLPKQTLGSLLQEPNTLYIGPRKSKYAPNSSGDGKWSCERLSYLLYIGRITPTEYRWLYEKFVRQKLWSDLHELEGKRLIFFQHYSLVFHHSLKRGFSSKLMSDQAAIQWTLV